MSKQSQRPVVVGVGGSGSGRAAIQLAAAEAGYRQVPLIAVTAYETARPLGAPAEERAVAELRLGGEVTAALGERASDAELRTVPGLAGRKLVETARAADAQLIVLASGLNTSVLAGAVSQYVLRNAPCPVLVVPDPTMD